MAFGPVGALMAGSAVSARAQDFNAEQHFKGKTIRFVVSWASGGTGNSYVRLSCATSDGTFPAIRRSWSRTCRAAATTSRSTTCTRRPSPRPRDRHLRQRARRRQRPEGPGRQVRRVETQVPRLGRRLRRGLPRLACVAVQVAQGPRRRRAAPWIVGDVSSEAAGPTVVSLIGNALGWNSRQSPATRATAR